jgi:subtilisin family serine protease
LLDQRGVINEVKGATGPARYIIQLQAPAAASYTGGIKDLAPTQPDAIGETKFNADSPAVQAYRDFLRAEQAQMIGRIEGLLGRSIPILFQYDLVLNGLTTELTPAEAVEVAQLAEVRRVFRDVEEKLDTEVGPAWIGAPGIWDGSTTGLPGTKGEGVIVGILDSGINHDHPSFAEVGPSDGYVHVNPNGAGTFLGWCDPSNPNYIAGFCNDKLIGAWDFVDGLTPPTGYEVLGPEDGDGHGSHTASTTAGNTVNAGLVAPTVTLTKTISGVAPHANIIAYDVCYYSPADAAGLCPTSSSLAAANQALADGVDVINYSIGGGNNPYSDSVELAFLDLFSAGVFVSTSAGNSGPGETQPATARPGYRHPQHRLTIVSFGTT